MAGLFPADMVISATTGIILSVVIVIFSPRLMKATKSNLADVNYETSLSNPEDRIAEIPRGDTGNANNFSVSTVQEPLLEDIEIQKSKKLQKVLGMVEHEVRSALRKLKTEDLLIKRTRKLQRVLGMEEQDIRQATKILSPCGSSHGSKESIESVKNTDLQDDQPVNWFKVLDGLIIFVLFAMFCYFFNFSTNGDFGRVIVALFPREFEALGLKERLERLSPTDPRHT